MDIEKQISLLEGRNKKVEADKAWETSWERRFVIALFTYAIVSVWLLVIGAENPFLAACIPVAGYILSTLSLPVVKKWWIAKRNL